MNFSTFAKVGLIIAMVAVVAVAAPAVHAGEICTPADSVVVVSDTSTSIDGGVDAVATWDGSDLWAEIDGATWIWESYLVEHADQDETVNFSKEFTVSASTTAVTLNLAADDFYKVKVNGNFVDANFDFDNFSSVTEIDITDDVVTGSNTLTVEVTNLAYYIPEEASGHSNPAGLLFSIVETKTNCVEETPTTPENPSDNGGDGETDGVGGDADSDASESGRVILGGSGGNQNIVGPALPEGVVAKPMTNGQAVYGSANIAYAADDAAADTGTGATGDDTSSTSTQTVDLSPVNDNVAAVGTVDFGSNFWNYIFLALVVITLGYYGWRAYNL